MSGAIFLRVFHRDGSQLITSNAHSVQSTGLRNTTVDSNNLAAIDDGLSHSGRAIHCRHVGDACDVGHIDVQTCGAGNVQNFNVLDVGCRGQCSCSSAEVDIQGVLTCTAVDAIEATESSGARNRAGVESIVASSTGQGVNTSSERNS